MRISYILYIAIIVVLAVIQSSVNVPLLCYEHELQLYFYNKHYTYLVIYNHVAVCCDSFVYFSPLPIKDLAN
jgi:hypothetical protein